MTDFQRSILEGIPAQIPTKQEYDMNINHAPKRKDILNKKHILIIHREINSQDNLEKLINVFENRTYGRSEIFFCNLF